MMAVTLLHGVGNLVCDGVDAGRVEFSIANPHDTTDMTQRGKVWGNTQAIGAAMNAAKTELTVSDANETLILDIHDLDRDGGAFFST